MSSYLPGEPISGEEFRILYDDDPDPGQAGQGLLCLPLIARAIDQQNLRYWLMAPAEQIALIFLLEQLRPKIAIEIGTAYGGSLQALSRYCERVYSIDIDPNVPTRFAGKFPNVEFLIGPSDQMLPPLLKNLQREKAPLAFALVDGDHSTEGVRKDIDHLLQFRPSVPLYIIMHDSFNPECREGLRRAQWPSNPHVHVVELDFVAGIVNPSPAFRGEQWGGLALAVLLPEERSGRFEITARSELTLQTVIAAQKPSLLARSTLRMKDALEDSKSRMKRALKGRLNQSSIRTIKNIRSRIFP
jgi:hypothetical protein